MKKTYEFAGVKVSVTSLYGGIHRLCREYAAAEGGEQITVVITPGDIEYERERATVPASDSYLETLAVYRKIAEEMPRFDTFLFHGSCLAADGEGYLFAAKSGTGKSTHARLWREMLGERVLMINDDKPLIRADGREVRVFGTPWDGKHRLSTNTSVPLKALCILERAEENTIRRITAAEALPVLLQQTYRPADTAAMRLTLALADRLACSVSLWRLGCDISPAAAEIAYAAMKGE